MKEIRQKRLKQLLEKCGGKKIGVFGDIMIDRYVWGRVARISPEAPVPVVEITDESARIGGAANVANNIHSLGGEPVLFGVTGDDYSGKELVQMVSEKGFSVSGIHIDKSRPTTVKTRIIAHNQHVVRTDYESKDDISESLENRLIDSFRIKLNDLDALIIQDYNKGVITNSLIGKIIELAKSHNCPVTVDPKFSNFFEYKGVTLFKPNIVETQNALGYSIDSDKNIEKAGAELLERLQCEYVLITMGSAGMSLFSKEGYKGNVKTKAVEIADVSGAGDTVIGTLVMMHAAGGDMVEAASIANHAAGVVVGEVGIVPIMPDKLMESFEDGK